MNLKSQRQSLCSALPFLDSAGQVTTIHSIPAMLLTTWCNLQKTLTTSVQAIFTLTGVTNVLQQVPQGCTIWVESSLNQSDPLQIYN